MLDLGCLGEGIIGRAVRLHNAIQRLTEIARVFILRRIRGKSTWDERESAYLGSPNLLEPIDVYVGNSRSV